MIRFHPENLCFRDIRRHLAMHSSDLARRDDRASDRMVLASYVAGLVYQGFRSKLRFLWTAPPGFGARRVWLAFTALSAFSVCRTLWSRLGSGTKKSSGEIPPSAAVSRVSDENREKGKDVVTEKDLEHLLHLLDAGNADMEWQSMMDKSTPNMSYQAWRHEPQAGPVVYLTIQDDVEKTFQGTDRTEDLPEKESSGDQTVYRCINVLACYLDS